MTRKRPVFIAGELAAKAEALGIDLEETASDAVAVAADALSRTTTRKVTVTATVMTPQDGNDEEVTASFEIVAKILADLVSRRRSGRVSGLVPVRYPLTGFEAVSKQADG